MKKLIVLLLALFVASTSYAAVNDPWSTALDTKWNAAEGANNSLWQYITARKDAVNFTSDSGMIDAIYCRTAEDNNYCVSAWNGSHGIQWSSYAGRTYNQAGSLPDDNGLRDRFVRASIVYGLICGGSERAGSTNCANFKDVLNYWTDMALDNYVSGPSFSNARGIRTSDSDEFMGKYFGVHLFAAIIKDTDSTRYNEIMTYTGTIDDTSGTTKDFGGLNVSGGDNGNNLRDMMARHWTTTAAGGQFIESSYYNFGTVSYVAIAIPILSDIYATDYFPEVTAELADYAEAAWNMMTPNYTNMYQWGDTQSPNTYYEWTGFGYMSNLLANASNEQLCYAFNQIWDSNWRNDHYILFANLGCTSTAPTGVTYHYSEGMGVSFWHSGWADSNETFFGGNFRPFSYVDHDANGRRNFNLWRQGGWAVFNPQGYYGDLYAEGNYVVQLRINGAFPTKDQEIIKPITGENGSNYSYSIGVAGGASVYNNYWNPPPENLHESTASHFFYHHSNGADTVIDFDRVNAENPQNLINYDRHTTTNKNWINAVSGKHYYQFFAPNDPSVSGNRISWTAENSLTTYLDTFITGFNSATDYVETNMNGSPCSGCGGNFQAGIEKWRMQLFSNSTSQHQTFAHIFHQGSVPTTTQYISTAGEAAKGYLIESGTENLLVIFNAADRTTDLPTPSSAPGGYLSWNSAKFNELKNLHYFKTSFTIALTTDGNTNTFIADLNPLASWEYSVDGGAYSALTVSSAGLANFTLSGSGVHTISVNNTGVAQPTCSENPDFCADQSTCEAASWCWEDRGAGSDCYTSCEVSTCDDDCTICANSTECSGSLLTCYWWTTDQCKATAEPTCVTDWTLCLTQPTCNTNGWFWCNDTCLEQDPNLATGTNYQTGGIGHWAMESDGATAESDLAGAADNLTVSSGDTIPQSATHKFGTYSRDFEADDADYLYQADGGNTDISGANQPISLCGWVYLESLTGSDMDIIAKYNYSGGQAQYLLLVNEDSGSYYPAIVLNASGYAGGTSGIASGTTNMTTSTWYHVCGTYDDVNLKIYLNGVLEATTAYSAGIYPGNQQFRIGGRSAGDSYFDGLIDDVLVVNYALTANQVDEIYSCGVDGTECPGGYTCNEGNQVTPRVYGGDETIGSGSL